MEKAARAFQNARGRLASDTETALKALAAVSASEEEVTQLEKEFERAKQKAAKL